jgi:hypothetical protein
MRANRATMLGAFFVGCLGVDRCGLGVGCVLVLVSWSAGQLVYNDFITIGVGCCCLFVCVRIIVL